MANTQVSAPDINFTNSLDAVADMGGGSANLTTPLNYTSVNAMRAALTAANGAYYTTARLDALGVNDMVFALRNIQDPKTIADFMTASAA